MNRILLFLALSLISLTTSAATFEGTYRCQGFDPYIKRAYSGIVTIRQQHAVYKVNMHYDTGEQYIGTGGQYNEELLSVVFQDPRNLRTVGLEQYHLAAENDQMGGLWVYLGKDKLGKEVCKRKV